MAFRFPSIAEKMAFRISQWAVFKRRGQRVIPAIEKPECRYHRDNFAYFGIREVAFQGVKMGLGRAIGMAGAGLSQRQGGTLGLGELRVAIVRPKRGDFFIGDAALMRPVRRMRLAILQPAPCLLHALSFAAKPAPARHLALKQRRSAPETRAKYPADAP